MAKRRSSSQQRASQRGGAQGKGPTGGAAPRSAKGVQTASGELPHFARVHVWQIQAVRDVLLVGAAVGLVWIGYVLRAVTVPLLVALLLAYLFEPLVSRLSRDSRVSRARAVGGLLALVVVVVLVILSLLIPLIVGQTLRLVDDYRGGQVRGNFAKVSQLVPAKYRDDYRRFLDLMPAGHGPLVPELPVDDAADDSADPTSETPAADTEHAVSPPTTGGSTPPLTEMRVRELVAAELQQRQQSGLTRDDGPNWFNLAGAGAQAMFRVLSGVLAFGLTAFLIPFYFFFFSLWYPAVVRFGRNLLPERNKSRTLELLRKMDRVISGFVRGRIIISLIMGVLLAVGWMICGVPYALVVGLVIGVFCAVPYLGGVGVPVAVGLLFFDRLGDPDNTKYWWIAAIAFPSVVFVIVQIIEGYALTPAIAGKATGLDPVTILVAILAGGSVLGIYGMLLAIPVAACFKILFTEVLLPKVHAWAKGEAVDPLPL